MGMWDYEAESLLLSACGPKYGVKHRNQRPMQSTDKAKAAGWRTYLYCDNDDNHKTHLGAF